MYLIQPITSDALQIQNLNLYDGSQLTFTMYYVPLQYGWFITSFTWNNFQLSGIRICNSPNMLRQWKNQLTFGIACVTTGNREPTQIADFSSGASNLYILNSNEVQLYEEYLSG